MKKLLIIFLFIPALAFSIPTVPNTNTFSLQDVCTEIYGSFSAGMNLIQCFTDATGTFDPAYVGSKNSLLNFRNYTHNVANTITAKITNNTLIAFHVQIRFYYSSTGYVYWTYYNTGNTFQSNTQSNPYLIQKIEVVTYADYGSFQAAVVYSKNSSQIGSQTVYAPNSGYINVTAENSSAYLCEITISPMPV